MDEEVSIINTNTRNEKIKNFFVNNKNKIIFGAIILLIIIISAYGFDSYKLNKKNKYLKILTQLRLIMKKIIKIRQSIN